MKKLPLYFLIISFGIFLTSCNTSSESQTAGNPEMPGFNAEGSDQQAIEIADQVMEAMGGYQAWDETRYLVWNFFGGRQLYWDKHTGDVRIDFINQDLTILLNCITKEGKVKKDGQVFDNADSIALYMERGEGIWINDSYWLVMPFKLKDSGVTLTYNREDTLPGGAKADVLQLTFQDVGKTPQNKYEVYVDQADHLIKQWAYFNRAEQDSANFIRPWDNYQTFGKILLSSDRSDNGGPRDVKAPASLPEGTFTSFEPVTL